MLQQAQIRLYTSLFSVLHNVNTYITEINNDFNKIDKWVHHQKKSFNPDPSKAQESHQESHPSLIFNNNIVTSRQYLGIILGNRLSFEEHLKVVFTKINKIVGLQYLVPRSTLLTIHKTLVQPHLNYCAIISKQAYNSSFHQEKNLSNITHAW